MSYISLSNPYILHELRVIKPTLQSQQFIKNRGCYIQTLNYDHISEENEFEESEPLNQEVGELYLSGITLEPSSNEHPEAEEMTEEERDDIN